MPEMKQQITCSLPSKFEKDYITLLARVPPLAICILGYIGKH